MQRKLLMVILIAAVLVTAVYPSVLVKADSGNAQKVMNELGIMNTDKGSTNALSAAVSRAEFSQMLINMSAKKDYVTAKTNVTLFSDVKKTYWAAGYIQAAVEAGYMSGYINGSFKPSSAITLKEAVYSVIKLLGYTDADFTGNVYTGMMNLYSKKNLNENISKTASQKLTRTDCINLFYNVLTASTKDGKVYGETLGIKVDTNGDINYLSLVNSSMKGPVVVMDNWKQKIPFALAGATYYKDGKKSTLTAIDQYNVLYYSTKQKTIWAYDNKVTGTVQSIGSDTLIPDHVTIGGTQYTLSTAAAAEQFAAGGIYETGDVVTLLLGKDNTVVYALGVDALNVTTTGIILSTGKHAVTDAKGDYTYTSFMTVVDASGATFEQDYDNTKVSYTDGQLVRITYTNGTSAVESYAFPNSLPSSMTFSADGLALGSYELAANVKILDYYKGNYTSLYASRLAGSLISSGSVIYCEMNSRNEITNLILNNVSGDLYQYGIYLGIKSTAGSGSASQYIINGKTSTTTSTEILSASIGPVGLIINGTDISSVMKLQSVSVKAVGSTYVQDSSTKYLLADNAQVYFYDGMDYTQTTLSKVTSLTKYKLTAYYDKTTALGGRVRVIIAQDAD
ncbi:S-layer homology domain-containing protein [Anaerocolumna xylanovorans]|uniref:S-layer homology domain-containing protein n=1 Tax=Anaerocolumna xylanovorans DSM 12503 TaxID=1121345 RepID=A0A1M7YM48_9FIRM|nr:S-layer homology domain-containing protein [Anaerocolumna xylanovorans]SHO53606.1 S-layer homology domain-containing protein [Anaerocolumna xylanovorans DSM 12503]